MFQGTQRVSLCALEDNPTHPFEAAIGDPGSGFPVNLAEILKSKVTCFSEWILSTLNESNMLNEGLVSNS